jgi:glycosyltransferase involved in cell wall biosynthesis
MAATGKRIAFVADELLGYAGNGIGTTTTFVSLALAGAGHRVEILFAGQPSSGSGDPEWQRLYDAAGVRVRVVPRLADNVVPGHFTRSRDVEAALRADPPDVVVVQDLGAPAYTALCLRRLGLDFSDTLFVVFCHGTRQWITDVSRKVRVLPGAQAVSTLERASVELADAVVSPSEYLVDWMLSEGWRLPERTFVIPHISRTGATGERPPAPPPSRPVDRVTFFGRLEERKGVRPFVGALNELEPELLAKTEVEFVGRPTPPWPVERVSELLTDSTKRALRSLSFHTTLDQHEALARLREPGTLVVLPSFAENSPNVVYECLENGIPFIASNARGIRELVAADDHERVLFEPTANGIAAALRRALAEPTRAARSTFDATESLRRWEDVFALSAATLAGAPPSGDVDVVIGDRREGLRRARTDWVVLLREDDEPEPALVDTLQRAQQASGADIVTCGLRLPDGRAHLFAGEPRALGLLSNAYGTVALIPRRLLDVDDPDLEADWPLLAKLSVGGTRVVSVPAPLVRSAAAPATLETRPDEALRVLRHFEAAAPHNLRLTAELVPRLAAAAKRPPSPPSRSVARRAVRRLLRVRSR